MVFWLYSAEQYATRTPLCELVEHAQERGFNDEAVDVLCLFGYEHVPEADRNWLQQRNFHIRDVSALYRRIAARYPNLRQRYPNHFFECFLRWMVLKEYYGESPLLAWDADIFFNEKLSRLHAEFTGATLTCSSTCFVALSDARWLAVYGSELDRFEQSPVTYLTAAFSHMNELRLKRPQDFNTSFFGGLIAAALTSFENWTKLFDSTPEEMLVDYLTRAGRLPHHLPKGRSEYLLCPLPLILPQLAWVHPMGSGLDGIASGSSPADLELIAGRYTIGGRPLAFLHFQGALFRACAAHQILHGILRDPAAIHDGVYCPPERRLGREVVDLLFDRRAETADRVGKAVNSREIERRWGDLYSERDIARNFLIQSDLRAMLRCYGLACLPSDLSIGKQVVISAEDRGFINQLGQFFSSRSFLQVEFTASGKVQLVHHQPGGCAALVRETNAAAADHGTQSRDAEAETVFNLGTLARLSESELPAWLKELWRITGRNLWVTLPPSATRGESWWIARFFEAGFRKHSASQLLRPFAAPVKDGEPLILIFEKIPAAALAGRPRSIQPTSGDSGDPLREIGVRAEARLARYELAAAFVKNGETIVDAGCGCGFGSAMLARRFPDCRVIGVDSDAAAIEYARLHYGCLQPNLEFHAAELCEFVIPGKPSVDLVACIDVLDGAPEPGRLLDSLAEWMKAGGRFVASAPNRSIKQSGPTPNPGARNGFDLPQFTNQLAGRLTISSTFRQIAGDQQCPTASRRLLKQVDAAAVEGAAEAEWWIIAAQKPTPTVLEAAPAQD